ncbi:IS1380 family transposase [Conexibacter sp. DBS9H8]|uniref:IS1380 family transposase n=1 Tax=Conexibacter sp. DBS9H8 TaxID=2937801 RepID=UPI00200E0D8B|nr:IS1380 family transposase [Conexibacter sp. DBS9H8]
MVNDATTVGLDGVQVVFDDERAVSDAGIALVSTLTRRLGVESLAGRLISLRSDRPGAANAGRKVMAVLFAMVLGADCIDDCQVLRAGRTGRLLGGWMPAPSTLGTFLRAFTFGHVRQLDKLLGDTLARAWRAGAGPGHARLVIDIDSFVGEVCGPLKQGAGYGYTKLFGYHPLLATRADTREALHIRLRKGSANTQKGVKRFCEELIARVERAGATGQKLVRADSGFWNMKVFELLEAKGWQYSIGVRNIKAVTTAIHGIADGDWQSIEYPDGGEAQIAETLYNNRRLIVRRTRLTDPEQLMLWPDWRHFCFITNRTDALALVEAEHRDHAVVEQVIADLKDQALQHFPSGHFYANAAWTVLAALAHNLLRWTQIIGLPNSTIRAARTLRRRLIQITGRLTRHARGWTLHLPARWPWHGDYLAALARIRALPAA